MITAQFIFESQDLKPTLSHHSIFPSINKTHISNLLTVHNVLADREVSAFIGNTNYQELPVCEQMTCDYEA